MVTKKKMTVPIFDYRLTILIYDSWDEVSYLFDSGPEPLAITRFQYGAALVAVNSRRGSSIIHEAEHIKNSIWEYIGYRPQRDNDEIDAYVITYIYNKIVDVLTAQHNRDSFNLYKSQRDADDSIMKELSDLKAQVAINAAIRPYQDKLIQCEIDKAFTAGINYTDRKTCNVIYGQVCLPNEPTITGYVGANQCGCPRVVTAAAPTA